MAPEPLPLALLRTWLSHRQWVAEHHAKLASARRAQQAQHITELFRLVVEQGPSWIEEILRARARASFRVVR